MKSFFSVDGYAYSRSFCGFFDVVTVNIFSSVTKMMLTSPGEYFQQLLRMADSRMEFCFTRIWVIAISKHKHFKR